MRYFDVHCIPERVQFAPAMAGSDERDTAVAQCSAGIRRMIARKRDGRLYQFGSDMVHDTQWPEPTLLRGDSTFNSQRIVHVASGYGYGVAVDSDGQVWSWGDGRQGCLGHSNKRSLPMPTRVTGFGEGQRHGKAMKVLCASFKVAILAEH